MLRSLKYGTMPELRAHLILKVGGILEFYCPPPPQPSISLAIRDAVGSELYRLEKAGVLRKVTHADWAAFSRPRQHSISLAIRDAVGSELHRLEKAVHPYGHVSTNY